MSRSSVLIQLKSRDFANHWLFWA